MKESNMAKGFAMLFVLYIHMALANGDIGWQIVLTHQSFSINNILGFMLPMFFIIAGFTYAKSKKSIGYEIKQRVWDFFIYFVKYFAAAGVIYGIVEVLYQKYTIVECLRALLSEFLTRPTCQMISPDLYFKTTFHDVFVAIWYVWAYLFAMLFFILLMRIPTKSWKQELWILIGTAAVALGIYISFPELPFELNIVPSMTFLMYAAQLVKKYKLYQKFVGLKSMYKVLILTAELLLGVYFLSFGSVGWLSHGTLSNPYGIEGMVSLPNWAVWILTMSGCLLMSFWLFYMCRLLMKITVVADFLAYFGVNSLDTMLLHGFFAMTLCELTGLICGRCLNITDIINLWMKHQSWYMFVQLMWLQVECWFMFVLSVVMCYFWPKLKRLVIQKVMVKNE